MTDKFLALILYPALADGLSRDEQEELKKVVEGMEGIEPARMIDALSQRITYSEMLEYANQVPDEYRQYYYSLAKQIALVDGLTTSEKTALKELAEALKIPYESEPFEIPVDKFEPELRADEKDFISIARKFSMIAGAIGFLPTPFISDFMIIAPLQVYMVNKIAILYNYPLSGKELIKMVSGTIGLGYTCAVVARGLLAFVPIGGWFLAGGIAFAGTYAIAIIAQKYIEHKGDLSKESIKNIYNEAYEEGKKQFKLMKNDIAKEKDNLLAELNKFMEKK
jgi:uncharacterized protein (DUF697 family)